MNKKKPKGNIRHYYIDVFETDVLLIQCKYEDFLSLAKTAITSDWYDYLVNVDKTEIEHDSTVKARQYPFTGGGSVIWANENAKIGELVHEIVHVVFWLCKRKGIGYNSDSEEIYAYLTEAIFNNLVKPSGK